MILASGSDEMKFVRVPHGSFWMGGGGGQPGDRQVEIGYDFYLGHVSRVTRDGRAGSDGEQPRVISRDRAAARTRWNRVSDEDLKHFP